MDTRKGFLFIKFGLRVFYHQSEKHIVIGNTKIIWSHDLTDVSEKSIIPLDINNINENNNVFDVYSICSDYLIELQQKLKL